MMTLVGAIGLAASVGKETIKAMECCKKAANENGFPL